MKGCTYSYRQDDKVTVVASDECSIMINSSLAQSIFCLNEKTSIRSIQLKTSKDDLVLFSNLLLSLKDLENKNTKEKLLQCMSKMSSNCLFSLVGLAEITNVLQYYKNDLHTLLVDRISNDSLYNKFDLKILQNNDEEQIVRKIITTKINSFLETSVVCNFMENDDTKKGFFIPLYFNDHDVNGIQVIFSTDVSKSDKAFVWKTKEGSIQLPLSTDQIVKNISHSEDHRFLACVICDRSSSYDTYDTHIVDTITGSLVLRDFRISAVCFKNNTLYYGMITGEVFSKKLDDLVASMFFQGNQPILAISVNNRGDIAFCTSQNTYIHKDGKTSKLECKKHCKAVDVYVLPTQNSNKMVLFVVGYNSIKEYVGYLFYVNAYQKKYNSQVICFQGVFTSYKSTLDGKTLVLAKQNNGTQYQYVIIDVENKTHTINDRSPYSCCIFNEKATRCIEILKTSEGITYYNSSPYISKEDEDCTQNYLKTAQLSTLFLLYSIINNKDKTVLLWSDDYDLYKKIPEEIQKKIEIKKSVNCFLI